MSLLALFYVCLLFIGYYNITKVSQLLYNSFITIEVSKHLNTSFSVINGVIVCCFL